MLLRKYSLMVRVMSFTGLTKISGVCLSMKNVFPYVLSSSIVIRSIMVTVSPKNGDVYVADAIDYQQQGMIYRYTEDGELVDEFYVGIIPGAFCWK